MDNNLSELIHEINEQVLYLQELGVDSLDAILPEIMVANPKSQVANPTSDYVVPDIPVIQTPKTKEPVIERPNETINRLSRLPSLSKRTSPPIQNNPPQIIAETMPKKQVTSENILFDITKALPDANETVEQIRAEIGDCKRCELCSTRTNIAHSKGNLNADLMFIGEAPGADEDEQGEPFVGRAGQLLTKIIESIGIKREDVFIGNINRCRPPGNRQPSPVESAACKPFLFREIAAVKPKVIVVLGNTACQNLLETKVGITKLRGEFHDYFGTKVMPTFHPAYLLRDPHKKREVWEDMKKVRDFLATK